MTLKKDVQQNGSVVKVTFYTQELPDAKEAFLVGDFNDWNESSHPMSQLKDGRFKLAIKLEPGKEYQFRYRVDGEWQNEWDADKYASNPYSGDNSVVVT